MRHGLGPVLVRIAAIITGLLLVGIVLRLMVAILSPVLPSQLSSDLVSGWNTLVSIVSPALAPIFAVAILAAIIWIIIGRRR